jgi:hypothetical protein
MRLSRAAGLAAGDQFFTFNAELLHRAAAAVVVDAAAALSSWMQLLVLRDSAVSCVFRCFSCGAALLVVLAVTSWAQDFGGRGAANPLPCQCSDVDPRESFISTVPFTCWYVPLTVVVDVVFVIPCNHFLQLAMKACPRSMPLAQQQLLAAPCFASRALEMLLVVCARAALTWFRSRLGGGLMI